MRAFDVWLILLGVSIATLSIVLPVYSCRYRKPGLSMFEVTWMGRGMFFPEECLQADRIAVAKRLRATYFAVTAALCCTLLADQS
jgi:hypothetical protein